MVNLEIIRDKLENILNGTDSETSSLFSPASDKYFFSVATEGFEFKNIYDMESGKNFIPVFIGSSGGEFNPIPDLNEYSLSVQCQVFFPVRFKQDFYTYFTDFIRKVFVGKILTYEEEKVLSNISVPQYGEIETFAVKEFKNFIANTYKMPFEVSEQWMSMTFIIYLSGIGGDFIYGNLASGRIDYKTHSLANPIYAAKELSVNVQVESEQVLGQTESKSLGVVSGYATSVSLYVEKNSFFYALITDYYNGVLQNQPILMQEILYFGNEYGPIIKITNYIISTASLNIKKGEPITITLNLVKGKE